MYVYLEKYGGESLADLINRTHVNTIYLPGFRIPENIEATCDLKAMVAESDILALVYPPRYVPWLLRRVKDSLKPGAYIISFCKVKLR